MTTIAAIYISTKPLFSKKQEPFYLGPVPIVEPAVNDNIGIIQFASTPFLKDYAILTSGCFFTTLDLRIGIVANTSVVLSAMPDNITNELLSGLEGWIVREIDFETYCMILERIAKQSDMEACKRADDYENAYMRYYGITAKCFGDNDEIRLVVKSSDVNVSYATRAKNLDAVMLSLAYWEEISKKLQLVDFSLSVTLVRVADGKEPTETVIYSINEKK